MAFNHGKKQVFKLDNSANVLTALTTYLTQITLPKSIDLADVTTLSKNSKNFVIGLEDNKITLSGKWDPTLDGIIANLVAALRNGTLASATFEYGPAGSATGAVRITGESFVASYEVSGDVGDAVDFSLELQVNDDVTVNTWP